MPDATDLDDLAALRSEVADLREENRRLIGEQVHVGAHPLWTSTRELVQVGDCGDFAGPGGVFRGQVVAIDGETKRVRVRARRGGRHSVPFGACEALAMRGHLPRWPAGPWPTDVSDTNDD